MRILALESSCDDTAVAIMDNGRICVNLRSSQDDIHTKFGGVVPELASREHLRSIYPLVAAALNEANIRPEEIELIAATQGPGLIGSLLVGFSYAKALAYMLKVPLIGIDHLAGHILSVFLGESQPKFPYISLLVSGGTTAIYLVKDYTAYQCLGRTRDDAAGEAFDKTAKLLGLPYPGGVHIANYAKDGNATAFPFPRAWLGDSYDFSFSGLKTAVRNQVENLQHKGSSLPYPDICASFEEAVVNVLVTKTIKAAREYDAKDIAIGGGVAANAILRQRFETLCKKYELMFHAPPLEFCSDNAAMIAFAAEKHFSVYGGCTDLFTADVFSRSALGQ